MLVRVEPGVVATPLDHGVLVVLCETTGKLHQCNPTGTVMWRSLIEHDGDADAAARATAEHYGIEAQTVRDDLDKFVDLLRAAGLVRVEP